MKIRLSLEQRDIKHFMDMVISKYHFSESDREELVFVYKQMLLVMSPFAVYKINQRVTGIKAIDDGQAAIVVMTLGCGLDKLKEQFDEEGELTRAYMLDCISNELLIKMYTEFNNAYSRFHRRYVTKYHFIGNDIGLDKVEGLLFELYGKKTEDKEDEEYEITVNDYGVLTPEKSVIFYALLSENPESLCEGICVGCDSETCDNSMRLLKAAYGN